MVEGLNSKTWRGPGGGIGEESVGGGNRLTFEDKTLWRGGRDNGLTGAFSDEPSNTIARKNRGEGSKTSIRRLESGQRIMGAAN